VSEATEDRATVTGTASPRVTKEFDDEDSHDVGRGHHDDVLRCDYGFRRHLRLRSQPGLQLQHASVHSQIPDVQRQTGLQFEHGALHSKEVDAVNILSSETTVSEICAQVPAQSILEPGEPEETMKWLSVALLEIVVAAAAAWSMATPASALDGCGKDSHRAFFGLCIPGGQKQNYCEATTGRKARRMPDGTWRCVQ
jgi:hypothetical protein